MKFEDLKGMTISHIERGETNENDYLIFDTLSGRRFKMYHEQDCCETVWIEDIEGDLRDVIGNPILVAEMSTLNNDVQIDDSYEYYTTTWTFYKLDTIKGGVTLRWNGTSNGWYSIYVDFIEIDKNGEGL